MKTVGQLGVLGFIVTPRFTCILGKGDDAAAKISYEFKNDTVKFTLTPMTSDKKAKAVITLVDSPSSRIKQVFVDGAIRDRPSVRTPPARARAPR